MVGRRGGGGRKGENRVWRPRQMTHVLSFTVPVSKAGHRDADTEQRAKTKML